MRDLSNGGFMRGWVAYVSSENNLGSSILGVRTEIEAGKKLAKAHWDFVRGEVEAEHPEQLKWGEYEGHDGRGVQAVTAYGVYYLEEVEFPVILPGDVREVNPSYLDLQVIRLTIENGRLAQQLHQTLGMNKPLCDRVEHLNKMLDHVIKKHVPQDPTAPDAPLTHYQFPEEVGGELWEIDRKEDKQEPGHG